MQTKLKAFIMILLFAVAAGCMPASDTVNAQGNTPAQEKQMLLDYAKSKNLTIISLPSGLMYAVTKEGTGAQAAVGDKSTVKYNGMFVSGKSFENNQYTFNLGRGQVIAGWDQGVVLMKEGGKAVLLIPSSLGYGPAGSPPTIPGSTPLVFEVELVSTKH